MVSIPHNIATKITDPFGGVYIIYIVTICKVILFVEGTISPDTLSMKCS